MNEAYLVADGDPLLLLPMLARQLQSAKVLLLPGAGFLAHARVSHLQRGFGDDFAFVALVARYDVFPWQGFGLFEVDEVSLIFGEGLRGGGVGPAALSAVGRVGQVACVYGGVVFFASSFGRWDAGWVGSDGLVGAAGLGLLELRWRWGFEEVICGASLECSGWEGGGHWGWLRCSSRVLDSEACRRCPRNMLGRGTKCARAASWSTRCGWECWLKGVEVLGHGIGVHVEVWDRCSCVLPLLRFHGR